MRVFKRDAVHAMVATLVAQISVIVIDQREPKAENINANSIVTLVLTKRMNKDEEKFY